MTINIDSHDLTLNTEQGILNIRVLILLRTSKGFIFEKHEDGYYFAIGGRVKFNEQSKDAAYRELKEEIHNNNIALRLTGIIENFFKVKNDKYHEINFVYYGELREPIDLNALHSDHDGFKYIKSEIANKFDIRPRILIQKLDSREHFQHFVNIDRK